MANSKSHRKKYIIHYLGKNPKTVENHGETILASSLKNKIRHQHVCGGKAECSSCRIAVVKGMTNCLPRTKKEQHVTRTLNLDRNIRLACQTRIKGNVTISRPPFDELDIRISTLAIAEGVNHRRGEEKDLSIMFLDIEKFTPLIEHMPPFDVVYFLNYFFYKIGGIVEKHGARIIDYYGDGFLSVFGLDSTKNKEKQCLEAGLEIFDTIRTVGKETRKYSYPRLNVRIGVRTGKVIVGTIGTENMRKLAAMGDAVNMARRIEEMNKDLGTRFLMCNDTYQSLSDPKAFGQSHDVALKGKSGTYKLWEVPVESH